MRCIYGFLTILSVAGNTAHIYAQQAKQTVQLSVEQLFRLADENNTSIKQYQAAEAAAAEAVEVSRSERLPSINFAASASYLGNGWLTDRDFGNGMKASIPHFSNNFAIEAAQVVYSGGALSAGVALSELKRRALQAEAEGNRQDIRFLLIGNYLELYKLDNQVEVYRKNIEQTQRLLTEIRARHKEGLALRNDITRYELQLQRLELALTQTENSRAIINDRLTTLLGLESQIRIEPDRSVTAELPKVLSEGHWQEAAADNAPALRLASIGVAQSEQGVRLAQAERRPSISLFAGDKMDGPITVEVPPLNKNMNYWYVGVGVSFNLASLYKSPHAVRQAKHSMTRANTLKQLAAEQLHSDVREAYIRFSEAFDVCRIEEKNLELAVLNYSVVHNRYINDLALITDILDADNAKLSAELEVANAQVGILFNWYRLKKIAGEL